MAPHSTADAIIREVVRLGDQHGIRSKVPPAEAVQRLTPFSRSWPWAMTTVVVGVRPRSGEALFFGQVAAELLDKAPCSLLMVASEPFVARVDRELRTEELTTREFTCGGWVR